MAQTTENWVSPFFPLPPPYNFQPPPNEPPPNHPVTPPPPPSPAEKPPFSPPPYPISPPTPAARPPKPPVSPPLPILTPPPHPIFPPPPALCCFIRKKKKKMVQEMEEIDFDDRVKIQEIVLPGPHNQRAVVLSVEEDIHAHEKIQRNEIVATPHHPQAVDSTQEVTD
ncbi:hypothetical protein Nepgr_026338 [Nepenthes gracilis]|uniref:Uncharacterized protein n=1 Tax=Nepenthes gracilis TaxID=150966 RepID=A0AAD3Y1Y1_NEPGR|nr:hypothetical protein Nepgr_026338 [Nepenthes gracilis]